MDKITIAHLTKPFGLKGEIKGIVLTSFPEERFIIGKTYELFSSKKSTPQKITLKHIRESGGTVIFSFNEIDSIEKAEEIADFDLVIDKNEAPMPEGTYRFGELIGCEVYDSKTKEILGVVKDVLDYATTKTLRISRQPKKDFFIPFHHQFIGDIDLENKKIEIFVMEGML